MLYLAHINVTKSYYESKDTNSDQFHIVEAESESDVETKLEVYYDKKNETYYLSFSIIVIDINEIIS